LYEGFAGLKGKLSNSVGYNVRASYGKDENKALFKSNQFSTGATTGEGYEYGNSFNVVYDDVNTLSVFGELKVDVSNTFTLGITGEYFSYDTTNEAQPWNLPELKASLFSNFTITEQLYGGASLFYVGEREDISKNIPLPFEPIIEERIILDGYLDANVHVGYNINERLSVFAKGSNLLSDNYEKWLNYPVQGIQALVGATCKFDW
ncbi:MAG TPA: TonB-dependent receptor, partial [Flavobacteriaceae bacterium]|nr:TonB-dependent receptor [Flavobacteriaceae bacterium]